MVSKNNDPKFDKIKFKVIRFIFKTNFIFCASKHNFAQSSLFSYSSGFSSSATAAAAAEAVIYNYLK